MIIVASTDDRLKDSYKDLSYAVDPDLTAIELDALARSTDLSSPVMVNIVKAERLSQDSQNHIWDRMVESFRRGENKFEEPSIHADILHLLRRRSEFSVERACKDVNTLLGLADLDLKPVQFVPGVGQVNANKSMVLVGSLLKEPYVSRKTLLIVLENYKTKGLGRVAARNPILDIDTLIEYAENGDYNCRFTMPTRRQEVIEYFYRVTGSSKDVPVTWIPAIMNWPWLETIHSKSWSEMCSA